MKDITSRDMPRKKLTKSFECAVEEQLHFNHTNVLQYFVLGIPLSKLTHIINDLFNDFHATSIPSDRLFIATM